MSTRCRAVRWSSTYELQITKNNRKSTTDNPCNLVFPDYFLSHDYVYKDVWFPLIEKEGLECLYEKENGKYKFAISVHRNQLCQKLFVGHLPLNLLKILLMFLQLSSSILGVKWLKIEWTDLQVLIWRFRSITLAED